MQKSASSKKPATGIDDYIAAFPKEVQEKLETIRTVIRKSAPAAEEKISYGIPTFFFHGNLVHFAGYKNHIGFYPGAGAIKNFKPEIEKYKYAKGSVQFPLDKPLPVRLISKIVKANVIAKKEKISKLKKG